MWTSTLDLDPKRVLITRLLGRVWSGASFSSFAPLQVQNLPRQPLPEKTWVRVRNRLAGICGSDLHMIQGDGDFSIAPAALPLHRRSYPGHEVIGEVLEVGEDVQRIRVGDRVVLQYGPNCLSAGVQTPCRSCAHGYYNLCEYGKLPGPQPIGGGWSEEMLLPEQQLFRLPVEISDEQAVVLEPTAVAIHAVLRRLPQPDERVLIIGAGAIGLLTLQIVRALAPQAEISVLARHSFQIEQATRQGAAHIIYPQDSYTGIQRATNAQVFKGAFNNRVLLGGYDVIFDTVGSQKTLHHALRWAGAQATVVLVGVNLHQMHLDLTPIWYREVNVVGSMGSGIETWPPTTNERRSTFEVAAELITHDQIHPEHLITHRFPLNNFQTALLTAMGKEQSHAIKVIFDYSLVPPSVVPNVRASAPRKHRPLPVEENISTSENLNTAQSAPLPTQPTEPAPPAVSLSPLFSSSRTVAPVQRDNDELDEMEDTLSAPAIVKYNRQSAITQQQNEQLSEEATHSVPEAVSLETTPAPSTSKPENHADEPVVNDEISLPAEEPENHTDEPVVNDEISLLVEEPSTTTVDTLQVIDEPVIDDDTLLPVIEEPSTIATNTIQADEISETAPEMPQNSDALQLPAAQEASEHSIDVPTDTYFFSEESATEASMAELPEIALPDAQDVPPSADFVIEKETDPMSATENPGNALLHTDRPPIAKIQNRPRPRTRKKNNRTSVERL
jgi:threonine dehydrogenase-like Zn-dependent dehydrogenase